MGLLDGRKLLINLRNRPERLERSMGECRGFFGADPIAVVRGVRNRENPMVGIAESHQSCVRLAKEEDLPHVIVMEDDIRFLSQRARRYADAAFSDLPEDWELLTGGVFNGLAKKYNDYLSCVEGFYGAHFLVVRETVYDRILGFDRSDHIDKWMGKNLRTYTTNKMFAAQHDGHSDNSGKHLSWSAYIKDFPRIR